MMYRSAVELCLLIRTLQAVVLFYGTSYFSSVLLSMRASVSIVKYPSNLLHLSLALC
jgi:hypothetical protein